MRGEQFLPIVIGLFVVVIVSFLMQKSSALSKRLLSLVASFGWEAPRQVWWSGAMRGRWHGFDVGLRHIDGRGRPSERLLLTVTTSSTSRLTLKRRTGGILSRPMSLSGPPIVEPMNMAARERYWVRADELAYAERLFSHPEVASALEPNLIAPFDVVELRQGQLRLLRAVNDRAVKKRFNRPFVTFGRDLELIEAIATEEWRLSVVIVEKLGLRGYEVA